MAISERLKQRFCKDNNLSIQLFSEPYFTDRIKLLGYEAEYNHFKDLISNKFNNSEEAYFNEYNELKDKVIDFIKKSEAYEKLQQDDMSKYQCKYQLKQSDVYKIPNISREFVSIDMQKANFSALVYYGESNNCRFFDNYSYKEFMKQFTDEEHFINSKYIRQVVFGNCNPKRQVTYEKWLMSNVIQILTDIIKIDINEIYSLCSDEIIIHAENLTIEQESMIYKMAHMVKFPLRIERFTLGVITSAEENKDIHNGNIYAFVKKVGFEDYDLKCVEPINMPFVMKTIKGYELTEDDLIFSYNGKLAKFLEEPKLRLNFKEV